MYEEYFGLRRPPFKISPDTSLFYEGGKRGDILGALVYAIHRGEGIVKVVGEVGSGKTMLCRMLQLKLPKSVEIIYIANPSVSAEDILFVIAHELELPTAKDSSKHEVVNMLQDYLLQRHIENKQVVLFIEEAQGMPLDTLEEIRLLSNLETDQHKLLQIILFGQPELDENLAQKSIRQLRERITHNFNLSPLTPAEIHNYLNFRMREVGYAGPELITSSLAKKVAQYSGGLLRRINIIADKILLSAFAEGTHNLTSRHVLAAVNDSAFGDDAASKKSSMMWWLVLPILLALVLAIYKSEPLWGTALTKLGLEPVDVLEKLPIEAEIPARIEKPVTENSNNREDTGAQTTETLAEKAVAKVVTETIDTEIGTAKAEVEIIESEITVPEQKTVALVEADSPVDEEDTQSDPITIEAVEVVPEEIKQEQENDAKSDPITIETVVVVPEEIKPEQENDAKQTGTESNPIYHRWLSVKLQQSREWLSNAGRDNVSIQVLMSKKSKERELVDYLQNEWPLSLDKTYLYEVDMESQKIYRVFYSEFESVAQGQHEMQRLPESVKENVPYLHSVYRMQKALL